MNKIYRAGIIPFIINDSKIEMMFMKPSNSDFGGSCFQIAKGRVDEGEDDLTAALREGYEELGLLSSNINRIIDIGSHLGRTHIYLAEVFSKENFTSPHFETGETIWLSEIIYKDIIRNIHISIIDLAIVKIKELSPNNMYGLIQK